MRRLCLGCGAGVPDLPYVDGTGEYCSATCRWVSEWDEPYTPFQLPGDRPCQDATCGRIIRADGDELAIKDGKDRLLCVTHHIAHEYALVA